MASATKLQGEVARLKENAESVDRELTSSHEALKRCGEETKKKLKEQLGLLGAARRDLELERDRLETSSALSWEQAAAAIQQLVEKCKSEIAKIERLEDPMAQMKAILYELA